jgi:predicted DNA-binding helix-hairpin-helix protein
MDCNYCQNSNYRKQKEISYEPEELAKVFIYLYLDKQADGLFISSAVCKDADKTTEKMLESVKLIREKYGFPGYIHFKILPGTSRELIKQAGQYADRLSINIEAPSKSRLEELTSAKDYNIDIIKRQEWIKELKLLSGQTTQMVVGAGEETDWEILKAAKWEYDKMGLERVYYSAFTPIKGTLLENRKKSPEDREHRLYSADYLMQKYKIPLDEFKDITIDGNLPKGDPKMHLALKNMDRAIDVNSADYEELIRIPGVGPISACRILSMQKHKIRIQKRRQLRDIGVVLKRAEPFIKVDGRRQATLSKY